jgi:hypothetical protein
MTTKKVNKPLLPTPLSGAAERQPFGGRMR